jgi:predicted nucleic-acid-binding Zn-ribbon protein
MNERIKQLAEQADNFADNKIQMPGEYHPDWHDVRDEKFAELIVRECADIARLNTRVDSKVYLMIQEHFGVEE